MRDKQFPYEVALEDGTVLPANFHGAGTFNREKHPNGKGECLVYCRRCTSLRTNPDRDPCLARQLGMGNHIGVELSQFL